MSKQGVAVFTLAYLPMIGGAEIAVKEITERLPNFQFTLFTHDFDRFGHGKLTKFFYIFRAWRAAEKMHRASPFGAIWAIMASYGGLAALLFKMRHPEVPLLLTLQEGDSEEHILGRVGAFYFFWKKIFGKADRIQVISNYLSDFAKRHGAQCPIEVVPNGVDVEKFGERSIKRSDRPNRTPIIITTSRLVAKNGVDILIDAMQYLHTPAELRIVGDGPQRGMLELKAKKIANGGVIIKFLGVAEPEAIPAYLTDADIFVRPSRSEGLGNSFLEAMAAGLPVVGTPVGGIPDFLKDGETGLLAKPEDPKDVAEKINRLFGDKALREKLAKNGQKLVRENYSWDLIARKMGEIFKKLCVS